MLDHPCSFRRGSLSRHHRGDRARHQSDIVTADWRAGQPPRRATSMEIDQSHGYDAIADAFSAARSDIGVGVVRRWAKRLPAGGRVVDVGCGSGVPIAQALMTEGLQVSGIDASPTLISMFRERFPHAPSACEPAETSDFFGQRFDGATAVGLLFLLPRDAQREVLSRVSRSLQAGGRFLFSAPTEACSWNDALTGRSSISLGEPAYRDLLTAVGMRACCAEVDEGGNYYIDAMKQMD